MIAILLNIGVPGKISTTISKYDGHLGLGNDKRTFNFLQK